MRLLSFRNNEDKMPILVYLIEGPLVKDNFINYDIIDSALLGTSIRDGFILLYSNDINHTMKLIKKIYNKSADYFDILHNKEDKYLKSLNIKTCKKENLNPETCYILQLSQIPNLSVNCAKEIAKLWPNFNILLADINSNKLAFFNKIKEIKVGTRKIGPVLSQKIIDYLCHSSSDEVA